MAVPESQEAQPGVQQWSNRHIFHFSTLLVLHHKAVELGLVILRQQYSFDQMLIEQGAELTDMPG